FEPETRSKAAESQYVVWQSLPVLQSVAKLHHYPKIAQAYLKAYPSVWNTRSFSFEVRYMRHVFVCAIALAVFVGPTAAAAQVSAPPNLQGIWQALNTAAWDIQDHLARLGVPPGQSVVEGNELPYRPEALAKKRQNFENRTTADPELKGYLPGVPRIMY